MGMNGECESQMKVAASPASTLHSYLILCAFAEDSEGSTCGKRESSESSGVVESSARAKRRHRVPVTVVCRRCPTKPEGVHVLEWTPSRVSWPPSASVPFWTVGRHRVQTKPFRLPQLAGDSRQWRKCPAPVGGCTSMEIGRDSGRCVLLLRLRMKAASPSSKCRLQE